MKRIKSEDTMLLIFLFAGIIMALTPITIGLLGLIK